MVSLVYLTQRNTYYYLLPILPVTDWGLLGGATELFRWILYYHTSHAQLSVILLGVR